MSASGSNQTPYINTSIYANPSNGYIYATAHQSTSDERLKTNWRDLDTNFIEKLANVKHGIYDRIDMADTQAGVSAQSLEKVLKEVISVDPNGYKTVNYGNAGLVAAIELAKEIIELRKEIKTLKASK